MILFDHVCKQYGSKLVLNDINLVIEGQEFVTIIGASGAGKTTLINTLIGAEKIDSGSITVDGYEISQMGPAVLQQYRRNVGMVFQDYKLLPKKTVYENVAFAMEVCGASQAEIDLRVPEVLEIVSLSEQKDQFPYQLSGGENQRTAIARALVHKPKLLLADEPTGNLDPDNTKAIIDLLLAINTEGTTVILASHDKEMVNYIERRVIHLKDGRICSDQKKTGYTIDLVINSVSPKAKVMELHID